MKHALFFSTLLSRPHPFMDAAAEGGAGAGGAGGDAGAGAGTPPPQPGGSFFQKPEGSTGDTGQGGGDGTPPAGTGGEGANTPPSGAPDWLIGKFAVTGENGELDLAASMEKQAQGYSDLFRSFSKKTDTLKAEIASEFEASYAKERGVPEDPAEYQYPDTVQAPPEAVDGALREWAKANSVGAEQFQQLINDVWLKSFPDPAEEAAKLGKTEAEVQARVDNINKWIGANIKEEHQGAVARVMQTADGVMFMEAIADMVSPSGFAPDVGTPSGQPELTRASIREMQSDPRFGEDEAYTKKVRDMWAAYSALPPEKRR